MCSGVRSQLLVSSLTHCELLTVLCAGCNKRAGLCHFYRFVKLLFFFFSCSAACGVLAIDKAREPITLVLAEDGTIVDDEDYFLCLPSNTKFVALAKDEKWSSKSLGML